MRKLMMAVVTMAGLGLTVGCQQKSDVQEKREDVAEAQRDVAKQQQEANREVAETRRDEQKDVTDAQRNLAEEQGELAKEEHQQATDEATGEATGGSGMAANTKTEEVKGTIQSTSGNNLTLIVPDKNNQTMRFTANDQVQVTKDDKPVALKDLKAGDEVRASYQTDANGQMVLRSIEVKKLSAQHPGQPKK